MLATYRHLHSRPFIVQAAPQFAWGPVGLRLRHGGRGGRGRAQGRAGRRGPSLAQPLSPSASTPLHSLTSHPHPRFPRIVPLALTPTHRAPSPPLYNCVPRPCLFLPHYLADQLGPSPPQLDNSLRLSVDNWARLLTMPPRKVGMAQAISIAPILGDWFGPGDDFPHLLRRACDNLEASMPRCGA